MSIKSVMLSNHFILCHPLLLLPQHQGLFQWIGSSYQVDLDLSQLSRHNILEFALSCFSCVLFFATPWTTACQAPLSMGFPRQEYWSGLPCPLLQGIFLTQESNLRLLSLPALLGMFFTTNAAWEAHGYIKRSLKLSPQPLRIHVLGAAICHVRSPALLQVCHAERWPEGTHGRAWPIPTFSSHLSPETRNVNEGRPSTDSRPSQHLTAIAWVTLSKKRPAEHSRPSEAWETIEHYCFNPQSCGVVCSKPNWHPSKHRLSFFVL